MSVHDWTRVAAGLFHAFHHAWIEEIGRALNSGILPAEYYALPEQHAVGFGTDILTLQAATDEKLDEGPAAASGGDSLVLSPPKVRFIAETEMEFYRRRQNAVVVRHISGDRMVAAVEIVSPGNKAARSALRSFVEKGAELLENRIHLLILDLQPPTPRDPQGIHGAFWEELTGREYSAPVDKPLTLAAYESGHTLRAYVEPVAVGDTLVDMPLFLEPSAHVLVPLDETYQRAFSSLPKRWRVVLQPND